MDRRRLLIVMVIIILFIPSLVFAGDGLLKFKEVIVDDETKVNEDVLVLSKRLSNKGIVVGDLVGVSRELKNYGTVKGDILGVGLYTSSYGLVKGNVRLFSEKLTIGGEVGKNVSVFCEEFVLDKKGIIDGSVSIIGDTFKIDGTVYGDVRGKVNTLIVNGEVKGNVNVDVEELIFGNEGKIMGSIDYRSDNELSLPLSNIKGSVNYKKFIPLGEIREVKNALMFFKTGIRIINLSGLLLIGLILIFKFPKVVDSFKFDYGILKENPLKALGIGSLILLIIPLASLILLLTIIGIPLGLILLSLYGIIGYLAKILVAIFVGELLMKNNKRVLQFIVGILIITILSIIPYLGFIINIIILIIGYFMYYINFKKLKSNLSNEYINPPMK